MAVSNDLRSVSAPALAHFPSEAEVPETKRHFRLRTLLYEFLALAFGERATIGCDQFVYWDPTDPNACVAPDAFVRLGQPDHLFRSWKTWESGAPELAIEVISDSDERDRDFAAKLSGYHRLGVVELVRFDPCSALDPLRIWHRVDGELVERRLLAEPAESLTLPGYWLVVDAPGLGPSLRLSRDATGTNIYPTASEKAEQRVRELEAQLAQRGG